MTEVVFVTSVQGHQSERIHLVAERVRKRLPDVDVRVLEGADHRDLLAKHKVQFGPAVLIDDRIEYVGIPRFTMLLDRLMQVKERRPNPRTAGEKPTATAKSTAASPPGASPGATSPPEKT